MSREIKFRCWNGVTMVSPDYVNRDGSAFWKENSIPTMSKELMQFTGLKDKNGVEIYEGDVLLVKPPTGNYPIKYVALFNDKAAFRMRFIDRFIKNETSFYDEVIDSERYEIFEIIGNIYEHPHLLK